MGVSATVKPRKPIKVYTQIYTRTQAGVLTCQIYFYYAHSDEGYVETQKSKCSMKCSTTIIYNCGLIII